MNLALHLANSVLLFLLLRRMTAALWRSAFVAGLFAVHPLHVESVAWVAERKDVLSSLFWILAAWAYVRAVAAHKKDRRFFILSVILFALGLMAKPMLVTLPFVLLLLDYWPLQRKSAGIAALMAEKAPYFVLSALSCVVTFLVQQQGGVMSSLEKMSLGARFDNVPVAYGRYLARIFWPFHLAVFYPHPNLWPWPVFVIATLFLLAVTALALLRWKSRPWLGVGWFWFLGMLVPVIGLVQVGNQSIADRYTYLPAVGIFIMTVWGCAEMSASWPGGGRWAAALGALAIAGCAFLTWRQARVWKDNVTLFVHTAEISSDSYDAFYNLGLYWQRKGQPAKAVEYYEKCLRAKPDYAMAHNNLGYILLQNGDAAAAITHFQASLHAQPVYPEASYNLGRAYLSNSLPAQAAESFRKALASQPEVAAINLGLGEALQQLGQPDAARSCYEKAVALFPNYLSGHFKLAGLLAEQGRVAEALTQYQRARQLALAQNNNALINTIDAQLRRYDSSPRK